MKLTIFFLIVILFVACNKYGKEDIRILSDIKAYADKQEGNTIEKEALLNSLQIDSDSRCYLDGRYDGFYADSIIRYKGVPVYSQGELIYYKNERLLNFHYSFRIATSTSHTYKVFSVVKSVDRNPKDSIGYNEGLYDIRIYIPQKE